MVHINTNPQAGQIRVSVSDGVYFFYTDDIIRLEASSNYTCFYFRNRKPLVIARVLSEYEMTLAASGFVRTHRSHLVNRKYVLFIDGAGNIIMQDDSRAQVSRRKRREVMQRLKEQVLNRLAA